MRCFISASIPFFFVSWLKIKEKSLEMPVITGCERFHEKAVMSKKCGCRTEKNEDK